MAAAVRDCTERQEQEQFAGNSGVQEGEAEKLLAKLQNLLGFSVEIRSNKCVNSERVRFNLKNFKVNSIHGYHKSYKCISDLRLAI